MIRHSPPPPGKSPAEYTYLIKDKEGIYREFPTSASPNSDNGYLARELQGGQSHRIEVPSDELSTLWETLILRFSYFIADELIVRGVKQKRYRDDAFGDAWWAGTEKLLFERGCPWDVSIQELQEAILEALSSEAAEHVRHPLELHRQCHEELQEAIRSSRARRKPRGGERGRSATDPERRNAELLEQIRRPIPDEP